MKKGSILKKEEEATIQPLFNPDQQNAWWQYKNYPTSEIERISNYFASNHTFLNKDLNGTDVKQNVVAIANKIGVRLPPYFTQSEYPENVDFPIEKDGEQNLNQEQSKLKNEESNQNDINSLPFFILNSLKLDFCTMKILNLAFFPAKIKVLRINNNSFDTDTLNELIKMINSIQLNRKFLSHKIVKLFFDWNNIESCENREYFYECLFKSNDIELLSLRKQKIDDQLLGKICDLILEFQQSSKLKFIDLFQNNITNEGLLHIERLIKTFNKLTYIGLGGNNLSQVAPIFRQIGKRILNPEELAEYRKKEVERDAIVQKNAKQKGKNLEEVPFLEPIKDVGQEKFAYCYNEQLQYLNLIQNPIGESDKDNVELFLSNCFDGFTLSLSGVNFEKKTVERLRKKFGSKIQFS